MSDGAAGPPVLAVDGLVRRFASGRTIGPFSLSLAAGERVALTGPNGSGKSTILRCLVGTIEPSGGTVRITGRRAGTVDAKRHVGVSLAQERSFDLRLAGSVNLLLYARLRHPRESAAQASVRALVEELELDQIARKRVDECSSGMVQQLALARALVGEPPLLVLDEPTRSLDDAAVERLWAALERRPRTAVLLATHRHGDVERCDRELPLRA